MSMLRVLRLHAVTTALRQGSAYRLPHAVASSLYRKQAYHAKWSMPSMPFDQLTSNRSFAAEAGFPDRADVRARVLEVVRKFEKVTPEKVSEESHFVNDLGLDSLDTVELVMALEDEFAIEIADADAEQIFTCADAVEYLANNIHVK